MMPTNPTVDVAELSANLARLTEEQHQQLAARFTNKMDLFTAYMYIESFQRNPETANTFCSPAMLVAGIAGRVYQTIDNQKDMVGHCLVIHGREGLDWTFLKRKDLFVDLTIQEEGLTFKIYQLAALSHGPIKYRSNCHGETKFPYATPMFAMKLLMLMQSPCRDDFVSLGMAALSAVGLMLRGETVEVLGTAGNVVHSLGKGPWPQA